MVDERPGESRFSPRRLPLAHLAAGAAAGTLIWAAAVLLGIPLLAGFRGYDFTPVAALLGAIFALTRLRRVMYVKAAALALLVAVIAYTPLIERPARSLIRVDPPPGAPPGAVVVLGEDITPDSLLAPQALDRMLAGAELVKLGAAPLLVVTRNVLRDRGRRIPAAPDQERIAWLAGIDPANLVIVDSVYSTRDEAVRAWRTLAPRGVRRVIVVTSPVHSGRACRTFSRVGFAVTCSPSRSRSVALSRGAMHRSEDRLAAFRLWLYEQAAFAYYHAREWI